MVSSYLASRLVVAHRARRSASPRISEGRGILYVVSLGDEEAQSLCLLIDLRKLNDGLDVRSAARPLISYISETNLRPHGYYAASETQWVGLDRSGRFHAMKVLFARDCVPIGVVWEPVEPKRRTTPAGGLAAFLEAYGRWAQPVWNLARRRLSSMVSVGMQAQ